MAAAGRRERTDRGGRSGRALGRRVLQPLAATGHGIPGRCAARLRRFHRARAPNPISFAVLVPSTRGVCGGDGSESVPGRTCRCGRGRTCRSGTSSGAASARASSTPCSATVRTLASAQLTCRPTKRFTKRARTNCERLLCDGGRRRAQRPPRSGGVVLRRVLLA